MIDLHTHLLWDWDDGPDDWMQSLRMCRLAQRDGVRAVCLTPHVFRRNRHADNLGVLRERMTQFKTEFESTPLEFHFGAEVYVHADVVKAIEKYRFTIDSTNYVFIEFPAETVPPGAAHMLAALMNRGFVPIVSHPERNRGFQAHPELLYEFVTMGCLAQMTAMSLTGGFGREVRKAAGLFMETNLVHFIATDAHDSMERPPILSVGVEAARKIVGDGKAVAMVTEIPAAILGNKVIPDWGEPRHPLIKKTWTERVFRSRTRSLGNPKKDVAIKVD
jgi:protein-tyrosine phosphatase